MTMCRVRKLRLHTGSTGTLVLSEVTGGGGVGWGGYVIVTSAPSFWLRMHRYVFCTRVVHTPESYKLGGEEC